MAATLPKILLVDDDAEVAASLERVLRNDIGAADYLRALTASEAGRLVLQHRPQVAVVDLCLDESGPEGGIALIDRIRECDASCRIIVLTGHGSNEVGVRALSRGVANFLEKPADSAHLAALIRDGIRQSDLRRAYLRTRRHVGGELLLGESPQIKLLREKLHFLANTSQPVLICGETGVGKGLCVQALHAWGPRASKPLVRYQSSFATPDLVNSELFGHLRGSFTGAHVDRAGLIKQADGGTLFLDEIDQLPKETQVALLGTFQDKRFRPVGALREEHSNFRLVCACNGEVGPALEEGRIRRDFYFRIAHAKIEVPPLRERIEDVAILAQHFLSVASRRDELSVHSIDEDAFIYLEQYPWPGNVRELEAVIEAAALHAQFMRRGSIGKADVDLRGLSRDDAQSFHAKVEGFKIQLVREALKRSEYNQMRAAKELGMDRGTLARILSRATGS